MRLIWWPPPPLLHRLLPNLGKCTFTPSLRWTPHSTPWTESRHRGEESWGKIALEETQWERLGRERGRERRGKERETVLVINTACKGKAASYVLLSIFKILFAIFASLPLPRVNHFACTHLNIKIFFNHQSQQVSCIFIHSLSPPSLPPFHLSILSSSPLNHRFITSLQSQTAKQPLASASSLITHTYTHIHTHS